MKLLIATKNPGKFGEISEVLKSAPIELVSIADIGITDDVEETGKTHEENAILKAQYYYKKSGLPTIGEDSGVYVDAFPGELGVFTRRFRGLENATDEEWIKFFLNEIKDKPEEKRRGAFVCVAAVILDDASFESPYLFRGETPGRITSELQAPIKKGIPLSSCFIPDGLTKVYAALAVDEKNKVSHRGKALRAAKEFLQNCGV